MSGLFGVSFGVTVLAFEHKLVLLVNVFWQSDHESWELCFSDQDSVPRLAPFVTVDW